MLKAGYVLCHKCGTATDEAIYSNGDNLWLQLKRTATGRFFVERYIPQKNADVLSAEVNDGYFRFELSEKDAKSKRGILHSITVDCYYKIPAEYTGGKEEFGKATQTFTLSCPYCNSDTVTYLIEDLGNLPTYVIAVVGARTVGKSSWITSIFCSNNISKLNDQFYGSNNPVSYYLFTQSPVDAFGLKIGGTKVGTIGETDMFTIIKKTSASDTKPEKHQAIANVLLVDFPGEIFAKEKKAEFEKTASHFFSGGVGFNGVDAVLFVTDPEDTRRVDENGNNYSVSTTFSRVYSELGLLSDIPFGFIYNKIDLLFEELSDDRKLIPMDDPNYVLDFPVISTDTFSGQNNGMYLGKNLLPRVALETFIAKKLLPTFSAVSINARCAGFLVKTAEFDENNYPDYSKAINVFDPLLWVLNQLDIFPIN